MEKITYDKSFSRIIIGPNESSNFYIYIFETKIELNDKLILNEPFGTSRTRFSKENVFLFNLTLLEKTVNTYKYELKIIKNNNVSGQFFWCKGWSLNLKVSLFPKIFNILNENELYANIPENYGNVILNKNNCENKSFQTGIIIPTFGRFEYLKKCLKSLKNTKLENCILILVDESLTKDVTDDKIRANNFIKEFNIEKIPIIKIFKNKHGNMFDSILTGFDILAQCCDYLITMDSDTIHKENWLDISIKTYKLLEEKYNKAIVLSGFNTLTHSIKEEYDTYSIKNTLGGCQMIFNRNIYFDLIRLTLMSHKWDTNITNLINEKNGILAVIKPSVIEHIGELSSVRPGDKGCVKTNDFND